MDTDVLVVGAGPTGLLLANDLVRRGIKPIIIDRHSGPAQQSRALAVHARTLEIYRKLGVDEAALAHGRVMAGANLWANGTHSARIPIGDIGTGLSAFPYVLILGQDANEIILGEKLSEAGVWVRWNTELLALEQHSDHVAVTLRDADGRERQLTASWIAGCDGSRSSVRDLNGIGFPGEPYEHVFFVADTIATGPMRAGELNVYLWRGGFHLFFPMRGKDAWRVVGILPDGIEPHDGLRFEDVTSSIRSEAGADLAFLACHWFSTYRIHHRAAERFRERRCFLLGDAAHVHSPAGGQGMNTGLQDAHNLGWRLAMVAGGNADDKLLDGYEADRRPVALRLLQTTDRAFQLLVSESWLAGLFRTQIVALVMAGAMSAGGLRRRAFETISQIGIAYPSSPLSMSGDLPAGCPAPGERFPWLTLDFADRAEPRDLFRRLDDTVFNLLVFGAPTIPPEPTSALISKFVRQHEIPVTQENVAVLASAKIPLPSWFLSRPDGHIATSGGRVDPVALDRYLSERAHLVA